MIVGRWILNKDARARVLAITFVLGSTSIGSQPIHTAIALVVFESGVLATCRLDGCTLEGPP